MSAVNKHITYKDHRVEIFSNHRGKISACVYQIRKADGGTPRGRINLHTEQGDLEGAQLGHIDPIARETLRLVNACTAWLDARLQSEADRDLERKTMSRGIEAGLGLFEGKEERTDDCD